MLVGKDATSAEPPPAPPFPTEEPEIPPATPTKREPLPPRTNKPKATFNLSNIGKVTPTTVEKPVSNGTERTPDRPIDQQSLDAAWTEFAGKRKHMDLEYQMLQNPYELKGAQVMLTLYSPVQEQQLQVLQTSLITFLRERLGNSSLMVTGVLKETEIPKGVYGNKGKFEKMAEENPVLNELKERFGLDLDS